MLDSINSDGTQFDASAFPCVPEFSWKEAAVQCLHWNSLVQQEETNTRRAVWLIFWTLGASSPPGTGNAFRLAERNLQASDQPSSKVELQNVVERMLVHDVVVIRHVQSVPFVAW